MVERGSGEDTDVKVHRYISNDYDFPYGFTVWIYMCKHWVFMRRNVG